MNAKEALGFVKEVVDETVKDVGRDPVVKVSAQVAATKMFRKLNEKYVLQERKLLRGWRELI